MNWKNQYKGDSLDCDDCLSLNPPVSHPDDQDALLSPVCVGNSDLMANPRMPAQFLRAVIDRSNKRKESSS